MSSFMWGFAQSTPSSKIKIIDISKKQIDLMNDLESEPLEVRNKIFIDSIYTPNNYLWSGYLGSEMDFIKWMNLTAYKELVLYNSKAKSIDLNLLNLYLFETVKGMKMFTGFEPEGKWYIFFGPKWTNLGGFADGTMLIDLAHESIKSIDDIREFFPHEINHQIYSSTNQRDENEVLYRILDEGFACYVSYLFHNGSTTVAEELDYTESEYKFCIDNEAELIALLKKHYKSNNDKLSRSFASRSYRFAKGYPGAIGYFIGFRIVEEYVKRNGKDSWKDIYHLSPEKVLKRSKILR